MGYKQIATPSLLLSQSGHPKHKAILVGWLRLSLPGKDGPASELVMEGLQQGLKSQIQGSLGSYDQLKPAATGSG